NEVQYPALNCLPLTLAQQRALAIDSLRADNDNDGTLNYFDADDDNDLVLDISDNCPLVANPQQNNSDTDALGDACDTDDDNDLVLDISDNCQFVMNFPQYNNDTDALGDACDVDDDNDLVLDFNDNCQFVMNFLQYNNDTDALGDACDADDDNDLVLDFTSDGSVLDNCQFVPNFPQYNNDTDADGDACDTDDDNDLVLDFTSDGSVLDNCQFVANSEQYNNDTDALGDACDPDDDNDLVLDFTSDGSVLDNCQFVPNNDQADNDNDLLGDACDPDDDNDLVLDFTSDGSILDNCQFVANADQADSDGDLIGDACSDPDQDGISDGDDVDADGDGLIEIRTAAELNMIRYNLQGTGLDADNSDNNNSIGGVTAGCGGIDSHGNRVTACNGYELAQDITLSGFWEPIGGDCVNLRGHVNIGSRLIADTNCIDATSPQVFAGIFDGNGYSIDGMRINLAGFTQNIYGHGLFAGTQGAVIRNLRLLNVDATNEPRLNTAFSGGFVGGLVGYALDTTIINSSVHGNIGGPLSDLEGGPSGAVNGAERSVDYAGGLVGSADQLQILGSYFNGSVVAETAASGLVGSGRDVTIRHSAAFGPTIAAGIYNSFIMTTSSGTLEIAGVYSDFDYSNIDQIRGGGHTMLGFLAARTSVVASYVKGTISTLGGGADGLVFSTSNIDDIVDKIEINASYVYDNVLGQPTNLGGGEYTEFTHPIYSTGFTPAQVSLSSVYWDYDTNRIAWGLTSFNFHARFNNASLNGVGNDGARGLAYPSGVLTNTNSFSGIYKEWGKYWCHPETYDFLRSDNVPAAGYIRAWDLGGPGDYPALNCHPISLAEQRSRSGRLRQHVPADPALAIRVVNPAGTGLDTVLAAP
ncbi:MAG: thrombospondin type 3 repeat-containing protein, partial [Gammaproteobacteria bacterium]|nr:thrombospondin type 3 repeat-containing protein [Gammaproteobacteria bacterium]